MLPNNEDFLIDLDRAYEAAERGDYRAAERWTSLAERKLAMLRQVLDTADRIGITPKMLEGVLERVFESSRPVPPKELSPGKSPG
ncbi:MAG: hypothetical protein Q8R02_22410 [Hyphomonadaceae bacterium]|nr:hypothetical protein [Hyphomonadaceae bacterium]